MRTINALLSTSVLLVFLFPQSLAALPGPPGAHVDIVEVLVDNSKNPTTIMIFGEELLFGAGPLSVTLGESVGPVTVTGVATDTVIEAELTGPIPDGDYQLIVSNGNGQKYRKTARPIMSF